MPSVGAGVNHRHFQPRRQGPLAASDLELGPSNRLAARTSALVVDANGALRVDARWIDTMSGK